MLLQTSKSAVTLEASFFLAHKIFVDFDSQSSWSFVFGYGRVGIFIVFFIMFLEGSLANQEFYFDSFDFFDEESIEIG